MIELIPAIDLINGQCVRLTKGDYDQKKVYNDNPAEVAKHFEQLGFKCRQAHFGSRRKKRQDFYQRLERGFIRRPPPVPQEIHRQGCALRALHGNQQRRHPARSCHQPV